MTPSTRPENSQGCSWAMELLLYLLRVHSRNLLPTQYPGNMEQGRADP